MTTSSNDRVLGPSFVISADAGKAGLPSIGGGVRLVYNGAMSGRLALLVGLLTAAGTARADVTVRIDPRPRTAIAMAAIDNLGRGAAGQAVQNMNLMFHLPETAGLYFPAVFP